MISKAYWMFLLALTVTVWTWPATAADQAAAATDASKVTLRRYDDAEVVKFPWGWIRWLMNAKIDPRAEMTLGIVHIEPNQSNPYHIHPNSAEYVHIISGSCEQLVGDKWVPMKAGDTMRFPEGVPHMARTGKEPCRAIILYDTGDRQMVVVEKK
ncbi:MAG: cupin domain-containing protein [Verrucomicrobiae bacterium]|nr:cupin domain-containing protein [Verrucomicrobiae bacterium]